MTGTFIAPTVGKSNMYTSGHNTSTVPIGPDLRTALTTAWGQTTRSINWMMSQLYIRDELRMPDQEKLKKMPKTYLYPEARQLFPDLPSNTTRLCLDRRRQMARMVQKVYGGDFTYHLMANSPKTIPGNGK